MAEEFYSFEKALRELRLRSEELKKLVSEGEIRAFREKDTMKFRKEDVEKLARTRAGGEEELVFADEGGAAEDTGMATAEISEEDTLLAEEGELEEAAPAEKKGAATVRPPGAKPVSRTQRIREAGEKKEGTGLLIAAIATSVMLLYGFFVAQSITSSQVTGMTKWLADMFAAK